MIAYFEDMTGFSAGFRLEVDLLPATLGRGDDATIRLTNVLVGRHHCEIDAEHDQFVVRDLGSMNGTQVNGQNVEFTAPLCIGDTLQIGLQVFVLRSIQNSILTERRSELAKDSMANANV